MKKSIFLNSMYVVIVSNDTRRHLAEMCEHTLIVGRGEPPGFGHKSTIWFVLDLTQYHQKQTELICRFVSTVVF